MFLYDYELNFYYLLLMPNLPTDNLYKFIALSGVFLFGFTLYFLTLKSDQLITKIYDTDATDAVALKVKDEILKREVEVLKAKISAFEKKTSFFSDKIADFESMKPEELDKEEIKRFEETVVKFEEHKKQGKEIENSQIQLQKKSDESAYIVAKLELATEHSRVLIRSINSYLFYAKFILALSALMAFVGFRSWYLKVQRYQDQILKKEASTR